jgi:hypothetical protein
MRADWKVVAFAVNELEGQHANILRQKWARYKIGSPLQLTPAVSNPLTQASYLPVKNPREVSMGLMGRMKQAEDAAHRNINRARQGWDDLERRMRQHWRIYPMRKSAVMVRPQTVETQTDLEMHTETENAQRPINPGDLLEMIVNADLTPEKKSQAQESSEESDRAERKPIVSINGKDVENAEAPDDDEDSGKTKAA